MGRKIFITYKYSDTDVLHMDGIYNTQVRDYVTVLQTFLDKEDHINKGEDDGTDLSDFKEETIASSLRDKIYDSSITLVMISKNMKDPFLPETDQWMPWEISYSLKEHTRDKKTSLTNAMLAIVLPDSQGNYDYFIEDNTCPYCNVRNFKTKFLFRILKENMFNIKKPVYSNCQNHTLDNKPYSGYYSYIYSVKWPDLIKDINRYLDIAYEINDSIEDYNLVKAIP